MVGRSYPYQSFDVKLRKLFGARYALDLGYFQRTLLKDLQVSAFNREYKRAFANF